MRLEPRQPVQPDRTTHPFYLLFKWDRQEMERRGAERQDNPERVHLGLAVVGQLLHASISTGISSGRLPVSPSMVSRPATQQQRCCLLLCSRRSRRCAHGRSASEPSLCIHTQPGATFADHVSIGGFATGVLFSRQMRSRFTLSTPDGRQM